MKARKIIAMYLSAAIAAAMFPTFAVSAAEPETPEKSAETAVAEEIPVTARTTAVSGAQMPATVTTKAPPSDELTADRFRICVDVHDESSKMVSGIKMRLEKVRHEWISEYSYVETGEPEIVTEWTTDGAPFWADIELEKENGKEMYSYYIVSDTLPKEYHYNCRDSIIRSISPKSGGTSSYSLKVSKRKYPDVDFPVTGKFSLTFNIADEEGAPAENLDCEFVDKNTGEVLYAWNTSNEPVVTISDLEYKLESEWSGYPYFAVRAKEMPGDYGFKGGEYFTSGTPTECWTWFNINNFDINVDEYTTTLEISRDVMYTFLPEAIETGTAASTNNNNTTTTVAENSSPSGENGLSGDANLDGKVTIADAAAILQYLGNKDKYPLSELGLENADCDGEKGITVKDAVEVQKKAAG